MHAIATTAAVSILALGVTVGHAADPKNVIRFGVAYVAPTGDLTTDGFYVEDVDPNTRLEFQGDLLIEPTEALGFWVGYERRFSRLFGLEATVLSANHDVDGTLTGTLYLIDNGTNEILEQMSFQGTETVAEIRVTPLMIGADFHVLGQAKVDLYLGPFVAFVTYGDLDIDGESIPIDDETAYGALVGVDVPVSKGGWSFSAVVRYLKTEAQPSESGPDSMALDVDPWIVQAGAGYKF